jgi:phosphoserine phosphatase
MSACRAYARAGLATVPDLPGLLLRLNQLLYDDLPAEKFVTFAAGLLDPAYATVHLISAGHGPLLFYSSSEDCFYHSEAQGPPLGLLQNPDYDRARILKLNPGDILVLVTDGFVEWANAVDEEFGLNRIQEVIRAHRNKPAAKIIGEMHSAILSFAGSMPQPDDLTALIVKRT